MIGVRMMVEGRRFRRAAVRVPGVIIDLRARHSGGGNNGSSMIYHPVLRFTTMDGRIVETESGFGSNPPPARRGAWVPVLYDPADPADARLTGMVGSGALLGVACVAMGGLAGFVGVVGLISTLT